MAVLIIDDERSMPESTQDNHWIADDVAAASRLEQTDRIQDVGQDQDHA